MKDIIDKGNPPNYGKEKSAELFRLELWVRDNPKVNRRLTQWASSVGTLEDRSSLRTAELQLGTHTASVRSFLEGRPRHLDYGDLNKDLKSVKQASPGRTRWNSYFSVPIYVRIENMRVSVGAITLSSSQTKADSALPLDTLDATEELIDEMIACGRGMLNPAFEIEPNQPSSK